MTVAEIKALPADQKLLIMEALWQDLQERFEKADLASEQKALLDKRAERLRDGSAQVLDWDAVKASIGRA